MAFTISVHTTTYIIHSQYMCCKMFLPKCTVFANGNVGRLGKSHYTAQKGLRELAKILYYIVAYIMIMESLVQYLGRVLA